MHARWNGEEVGLSDTIPYFDRPWEKEEYFLESKLNDCFRAEHKGYIDDLPSHEKNLKTAIRCVINKRENDKSLTMS
jgi:hypothetical protein